MLFRFDFKNLKMVLLNRKLSKILRGLFLHYSFCTNGLFYHPTTICTDTFCTNCIALLSWCNCTDSSSFVPNALFLKSYFALINCQLFILHFYISWLSFCTKRIFFSINFCTYYTYVSFFALLTIFSNFFALIFLHLCFFS